MKKLILPILFVIILGLCMVPSPVKATESDRLPDFSDDFEAYEVSGDFIENDTLLTEKWDNNVFRGGESLGMDAHINNVGKIEYENGDAGNKVLHLKNTTGADSFFYMGPSGDYRVKNFTVSYRVRFLAEGVSERSWVGISFRKQASTHYTGTNNLLFIVQRYVASSAITGHAYAIFDGGEPNDLENMKEMYGDKLSLASDKYTVSDGVPGQDLSWVDVQLQVRDKQYKLYIDDVLVVDCMLDITKYDYFGYLSLNCCTANVLIDDFNVKIEDETLPPEIKALSSPVVTLNQEKNCLAWEAVEGAGGYLVKFAEGNEKIVYTNSCSLEDLKAGEYDITVTALTGNSFEAKDSLPSNAVHYVVSEAVVQDDASGCGSAIVSGAFIPSIILLLSAIFLKKKQSRA